MKPDIDQIRDLLRAEEDAEVLVTKLRALVEESRPVSVFAAGEGMPMHEFLARYQNKICRGIVPDFYDRWVTIVSCGPDSLVVEIQEPRR